MDDWKVAIVPIVSVDRKAVFWFFIVLRYKPMALR